MLKTASFALKSCVKVVNKRIMVKFQILLIACPLEEIDDPFLLLFVQQPLPVMVAIIVAGAVEILSHCRAQPSLMLALDLLKQSVKAPCHLCRLCSTIESATPLRHLHVRVDGRTPVALLWQRTASKESQALVPLGTLLVKTKLITFRHIPKIMFSLVVFSFHFDEVL